jgi:hypothetical protein
MGSEAALLSAGGIVLAAFIAYLGVRFTGAQTASASRMATEMEHRAEITNDYRTLAMDLRREMAQCRSEMAAMRARVEHLEELRGRDQRVIRSALAYIRDLVAQVRQLGGEPLPSPVDLDLLDDR